MVGLRLPNAWTSTASQMRPSTWALDIVMFQIILTSETLLTNQHPSTACKGNLTILRRILHLDLAKGNPK
jgi:hypothetical protein